MAQKRTKATEDTAASSDVIELVAKRQIIGRTLDGRDLYAEAGASFFVDGATARDLLNAGYAVPAKMERETATAEE